MADGRRACGGYTLVVMTSIEGASVQLRFPDEETVPETKRHLEIRTALYQALKLALADRAAIGSDQFVYWDPTDPRQCLAPDIFVRLGIADHPFRTWKVWEHGAPQVAVEVISGSDERDRDWGAKLDRYRRLGVAELVRFDSESSTESIRVWDAVDGNLVERSYETAARSNVLSAFWVVATDPVLGPTLRLSHDPEGRNLYPTPAERAERRVEELEAELGRRESQ
jgi:Uma2 family endonuclease